MPDWTDQEIAVIRASAEAGESGALAAAKLGRTRSAVIGKAYRLGIAFHGPMGGPTSGKLTAEQVRSIRRQFIPGKGRRGYGSNADALAPLYGVSADTIRRVARRCVWASVIDLNEAA